jgi:hypothetical protein
VAGDFNDTDVRSVAGADKGMFVVCAEAWKDDFTKNIGGYLANFRYVGHHYLRKLYKRKSRPLTQAEKCMPARRPAFMGYMNCRLKNAEKCRGWPEPASEPTVAGSTSNKS